MFNSVSLWKSHKGVIWYDRKWTALYQPLGNETWQLSRAGKGVNAKPIVKYFGMSVAWEGEDPKRASNDYLMEQKHERNERRNHPWRTGQKINSCWAIQIFSTKQGHAWYMHWPIKRRDHTWKKKDGTNDHTNSQSDVYVSKNQWIHGSSVHGWKGTSGFGTHQ